METEDKVSTLERKEQVEGGHCEKPLEHSVHSSRMGQSINNCDEFALSLLFSSGGWKMPATAVPAHHCSTEASGWLNATLPTESQGKTNGTVCFNWNGKLCHWTKQITIQNCSNYFVYFLKKTMEKHAYCTGPILL
ncbi:uromodulin-like [Chiloscyllium plagiosum]|uniref:uromodulin-like n=1 Tax=Chiloscyllium plagiosum TaxID=36176 RepID=UPI001CB880D0|nr:uromodulin-like [Chiloscyllium plagiosum]